jgi:hypothetical protein
VIRLRIAGLALIAAAVSAACGGGVAVPRATVGPESAVPAATSSTQAPEATDVPASDAPAGSETPAETEAAPSSEPTPAATDEPSGTDEPAATGAATGGADACSGSTENREFFEGIARAVDWPVLCAVLPRGWFVSDGAYRLANGGRLTISYRGPAGATIGLSEGAFCAADDGCVPDGSVLDAAPLGPLDGALYQTSDGYAIIAAAGENPSWLLETRGLDRATTTALGASLAEVQR